MAQTIALLEPLGALFGSDRFHVTRPGLYVCEPAWSWTPPVFTDFDFWIVFEGKGAMTINAARYELRPGSGFLIQPGDKVEARHEPDKPLTVFACHIERNGAPGDASVRLRREVIHFETSDPGYFRILAEEVLQLGLCEQRRGALAKLMIAQMIVRALMGERETTLEASPSAINRLAIEIRSRPGHAWTTKEMARYCSLSVPHFNRQFRQTVGESPRQFLIHQRVRRAVQLLRESHMSIQQIAQSLGYNDHYFFHRQFRKLTGATPGEVRNGAEAALHD